VNKPLAGLRILVTRPRDRASGLASSLRKLGARVRVYSTIEIREPRSWKPVDREIARLERYDSVVFTSATGAACACIGPVTARAARAAGFRVVAQPARYTIPDLLSAILAWHRTKRRRS
jgi:uroporphyrinogen-III synthase